MSGDAPGGRVRPQSLPDQQQQQQQQAQQQHFDPAWYTWSRFFSILSGAATPDEAMQYIHAKSVTNEEADCARCEKNREYLLNYSPSVRFMADNIRKVGGEMSARNILCRRCDTLGGAGPRAGAFSQDFGILLCANHLSDKGHQEDVMTHEMIHAYDYLRFQYDRRNLKHVACTEIRASTLSGECRWIREFFGRGERAFTAHFQDCVRKRATLSVRMHADCKDDVQAAKTVNEVWPSCFPDTRPFDEIYK